MWPGTYDRLGGGSLFKSCSCPRHKPRCTALIILKEGTRVPMSWPGALGDREKNPGCPFTNQRPCQAEVQGVMQTRTHQRRYSQSWLNPERLFFGTELTASARTHQKLSYSAPKGHSQSGGFFFEFLISNWTWGTPKEEWPGIPVKKWWVRGSKDHNEPSIKFRVWFSNHKCTLPHSSAADTMLCVHNLWICAEACEGP